MNVFYLDSDPKKAAQYHCDKHCVKMIVEYAQLLSTSHRVLDGTLYYDKTKNGSKIKRWRLDNTMKEHKLYKASHVNHPSNIWTRSSSKHYEWLYECFIELSIEFMRRYKKEHASFDKLYKILEEPPINIKDNGFVEPPPAMPDYCKIKDDSVASYKKYYAMEKHFARWEKLKNTPEWFFDAVEKYEGRFYIDLTA
jgi:hypothetical protein